MQSLIKDQKPPLASNHIHDQRPKKRPLNARELQMKMKIQKLNEYRKKEKADRETEVNTEREKWLNHVFQPLPRTSTPQPS